MNVSPTVVAALAPEGTAAISAAAASDASEKRLVNLPIRLSIEATVLRLAGAVNPNRPRSISLSGRGDLNRRFVTLIRTRSGKQTHARELAAVAD